MEYKPSLVASTDLRFSVEVCIALRLICLKFTSFRSCILYAVRSSIPLEELLLLIVSTVH